jgi:hypothetical protein
MIVASALKGYGIGIGELKSKAGVYQYQHKGLASVQLTGAGGH